MRYFLLLLLSLNIFAKCLEWDSGEYGNLVDINSSLSMENTEKIQVCLLGEIERGRDFVTIYDSNRKILKRFSGVLNRNFVVNDSKIFINLKSDETITKSGVKVQIDKVFDNYSIHYSKEFSTGEYSNNTHIRKTLIIPDAIKIKVKVTGESEKNLDYLKIYDMDSKLITHLSGEIDEVFEVDSPSIVVEFISDDSVVKSGIDVKIEKVDIQSDTLEFNLGDTKLNRSGENYGNNRYVKKTLLIPNADSAKLTIDMNTELDFDTLEVKSKFLNKRLSGNLNREFTIERESYSQRENFNFSDKLLYDGVKVDLIFKSDGTNSSGGVDVKLQKLD